MGQTSGLVSELLILCGLEIQPPSQMDSALVKKIQVGTLQRQRLGMIHVLIVKHDGRGEKVKLHEIEILPGGHDEDTQSLMLLQKAPKMQAYCCRVN